ncbi:MAG: dihydrofolate reductase family protein [Holophagales bacterium]|nr:dihydrofolate reductase family protein [Holophagales bacterium]
MSIEVSVFIATSLDGFIARKDGGLDWLDEANASVPEGEDCGFREFMDSVDVLVMGRKTYEKVLSFGEWPYGSTRVVVLSRGSIAFPEKIPDTVSHSSDPPRVLLERLSHEGIERVYLDGGMTIQGFLSEGLVDHLTVTVIPILLGEGIPLFGSIENDIPLAHQRTKVFDFGFVQSTYSVARNAG